MCSPGLLSETSEKGGRGRGGMKRMAKKKKKSQRVTVTPDRLTCRERRSDRCVWAQDSWACASPDGNRRERWCGVGARHTPGQDMSRTAVGSWAPMGPSRRTDAGPVVCAHSDSRRVNLVLNEDDRTSFKLLLQFAPINQNISVQC